MNRVHTFAMHLFSRETWTVTQSSAAQSANAGNSNQLATILQPSANKPVEAALNFALGVLDRGFVSMNQDLISHNQDIIQILSLLGDEDSRQQYNQELAYLALSRVNGALAKIISPFSPARMDEIAKQLPGLMNQPDFPTFQVHASEVGFLTTMVATTFLIEQYRYKDLLKVEPGEVFIDCGACFGDTALWAYKNGAAKVYSFEPGNTNLEILKLNLQNNHHDVNLIVPAAVGEENTTITFFSGVGVAGAAHQADEAKVKEIYDNTENEEQAKKFIQKVPSVKLDDWFAENNVEPTFIKMDVEGAEIGALKGAAETIKRLKPKLTLCLYHNVKDMWEIPLLVHSLVPEYKLYCRKNQVRNEFILYAVVEK